MSNTNLAQLRPVERQALVEFVQELQKQFAGVRLVMLFGSKARGDSTPDSDLDVLIVIDSDDWRLHKEIRYLAVDICLKYNYELDISPRIWSFFHFKDMQEKEFSLYKNICRDGISLIEPELA
jgi:predicted nucleotidyltransferase